jgi:hypothetical protein
MKRKVGVACLCILLSGLWQTAFAQGNLLVSPTRVVFEGDKQKEDLNLTNIGQDTAVYLISFIHYRMQADGSFLQLESDSVKTRADKFLRVFPRKVVLPPGESQTIRMQYRKTQEVQDGMEYRSHLYFRAEKEVSALGMSASNVDTTKMSVSITPVFGISIPVIVRNGTMDYSMSISDVSLTPVIDTVSTLTFKLHRLGNRSSYGNVRVTFVPNGGKSVDIGMANGIGVYTDVESRLVSLLLYNRADQRLKNGKLVVTYSTPREEGEKVLAKIEYNLP